MPPRGSKQSCEVHPRRFGWNRLLTELKVIGELRKAVNSSYQEPDILSRLGAMVGLAADPAFGGVQGSGHGFAPFGHGPVHGTTPTPRSALGTDL